MDAEFLKTFLEVNSPRQFGSAADFTSAGLFFV